MLKIFKVRPKGDKCTQLGVLFLYLYFTGRGSGRVQSLILCAVLLNLGLMLFLLGVLADHIGFNRRPARKDPDAIQETGATGQ